MNAVSTRPGANNGSMWRLIVTPRPAATLLPTVTKLVAQGCNAIDGDQLSDARLTTKFPWKTFQERFRKTISALRIGTSTARLNEATA